jgi:hypothetical protein
VLVEAVTNAADVAENALFGVDCPGVGQIALAGGGSNTDGGLAGEPVSNIQRSVPLEADSTTDVAEDGDTPTGWGIAWRGGLPPYAAGTITVYAICA